MSAICPHCGFDLACDEIVKDGEFVHDPRFGILLNGMPLQISPSGHMILGALMREQGRLLTRLALAERIGYDGDDPNNLIAVQVTRLRNYFRSIKSDLPIESIHSRGLRWVSQVAA